MGIKKDKSDLGFPVYLSPENFQDQDLWLSLVNAYYSGGVKSAQFIELKKQVESTMVERFDKAKRQNKELIRLSDDEYHKSRNDLVEWLINYPWSIATIVIRKKVTVDKLWYHGVTRDEIIELQEDCLSAIVVPPAEINYVVDRGEEIREPSSRSVYHLLDIYDPSRGKNAPEERFDAFFIARIKEVVTQQITYHFYGHIPGSEKYPKALGLFLKKHKRYPKNNSELALDVGVSLKTIDKWERMNKAADSENVDEKEEFLIDPRYELDEDERERIEKKNLLIKVLQDPEFDDIDRQIFFELPRHENLKKVHVALQQKGCDITYDNVRTRLVRLRNKIVANKLIIKYNEDNESE